MNILLVEDNAHLGQLLELELGDLGFTVVVAKDGEEGLYRALNWSSDIIVLDIMLPKLNGIDVLKSIRHEGVHTPVLMLTAQDSLSSTVQCLELGADDYLKKPFALQELVVRLKTLVRRNTLGASNVIELGTLRIDISAKTVNLDGVEVLLKKQEWDVFAPMISRRGQILSKDRLYDYLIDGDELTRSNLLEVIIYKLRSKLGKDLIVTHRGLGYSIPK